MPDPAHVLVVAHQTAATPGLLDAIRARAERGDATFHLVVPRRAHGLHRVVDPHEAGEREAQRVLEHALPKLSEAAGSDVTGNLGDAEPLMAIEDAINLGDFDEIIISTLPQGPSHWLRADVPTRLHRHFPMPITHVVAPSVETHAIPRS